MATQDWEGLPSEIPELYTAKESRPLQGLQGDTEGGGALLGDEGRQ